MRTPITDSLTDQQRRTLAFIRDYIATHKVSPKLREIAQGIGIRSRGVAHRYVQALVKAGLLESGDGRTRGLRLTQADRRRPAILPLLGKIAAGRPVEAIPGQDEIDLRDFFGEHHFAIQVQGDSMIEAGILDGDTAIIRFSENARNGDIVVALIDESEATLKRFQRSRDGRHIKLVPANKTMKPMVYEAHRIRIQGILVGQMRRY